MLVEVLQDLPAGITLPPSPRGLSAAAVSVGASVGWGAIRVASAAAEVCLDCTVFVRLGLYCDC